MKKPVFADIAELVGGLLADEKKKKRRTAASKYEVIDVPALVRALPARPARVAMPARLPVVLVPGAPRDAAPAAPALKGRSKRTHLEVVRDLSLAKLAAVNVVQTKRRIAAAELLKAEADFYDPNKKRLPEAKQKRINAAYKSAQENDDKRARDLGAALAASDAAKEVYAHEQARVGIRDETPEPEEVFADSTPAKKAKTPKKSLDEAFSAAATKKATQAEIKAADKAAKAAERDELKAARIDAAAAAKDLRVEAAAAKATAKAAAKAAPAIGLLALQKRAKAQTAAREKGREKYYEFAGLAPPPELVGVGRFLGRFCH